MHTTSYEHLLRRAQAVLDDDHSSPQARAEARQAMDVVAGHLRQAYAAAQQAASTGGGTATTVTDRIEQHAQLHGLLRAAPRQLGH